MSMNTLLFRQNLTLYKRANDSLFLLSTFLDRSGKNLVYEISTFTLWLIGGLSWR